MLANGRGSGCFRRHGEGHAGQTVLTPVLTAITALVIFVCLLLAIGCYNAARKDLLHHGEFFHAAAFVACAILLAIHAFRG
jgi:hypothetical protein